jgi:hypothetical protein
MGICPFFEVLPIFMPIENFCPSHAHFLNEDLDKRGKVPKFKEKLPKFGTSGDNLSNFRLNLKKK